MNNAEMVSEALTPGTFLHDVAARSYRAAVRVDSGCWGWADCPDAHGYAVVRIPRRSSGSGTVKAHRLSYVIHHGLIGEGLHVLHSCDNRLCTNPLHLRLGTQQENVWDAVDRGRAVGKVESATIADLVQRIAAGEISRREAARRAGVDPRAVRGWVKARQRRVASQGAAHV